MSPSCIPNPLSAAAFLTLFGHSERLDVRGELAPDRRVVEPVVREGVPVGAGMPLRTCGQVLTYAIRHFGTHREPERVVGAPDGADRVAHEVDVLKLGDLACGECGVGRGDPV